MPDRFAQKSKAIESDPPEQAIIRCSLGLTNSLSELITVLIGFEGLLITKRINQRENEDVAILASSEFTRNPSGNELLFRFFCLQGEQLYQKISLFQYSEKRM